MGNYKSLRYTLKYVNTLHCGFFFTVAIGPFFATTHSCVKYVFVIVMFTSINMSVVP